MLARPCYTWPNFQFFTLSLHSTKFDFDVDYYLNELISYNPRNPTLSLSSPRPHAQFSLFSLFHFSLPLSETTISGHQFFDTATTSLLTRPSKSRRRCSLALIEFSNTLKNEVNASAFTKTKAPTSDFNQSRGRHRLILFFLRDDEELKGYRKQYYFKTIVSA